MHLARYISYWAREREDHSALIQEDVALSWRQLGSAASTFAATLRSAGGIRGDRLGCLLPNILEWCVSFAGAQMAEMLFVPLNPMFGPYELRYIAQDAGCRLVVASPRLMAKLDDRFQSAEDDTPGLFDLASGRKIAAIELFPQSPITAPDRVGDEQDMAIICYTSGTTGRPKGAIHSHRTIAAMTTGLSRGYGMTVDEVFLLVAPLSFTGGVICNLAVSLALGTTLVLERGFDPPRTLELIARHRVTAFGGAAIFWQRLVELPGFASADLSSLRNGFVGGSPVQPELVRRFLEKGVGVRQSYGCTEICGGATLPTAEQAVLRPESCGRPMIGLDIEIREDAGVACPTGSVGEICLRGPQVMLGYWNQPQQTAAAFDGDWFRSGDLGYLNEHLEVIVVDRKKNIVISGGVNIYPAEVEAVLRQIDGVTEAVVFGVASNIWGEELVAVLSASGDLDLEEIGRQIRELIGPYKTPKRIIRTAQPFERTNTGKLARARIIETHRGALSG
jgi:fatty-acyl-CoA synthase